MQKNFYKATDIEGKVFVLIEVTKTPEGDKVREASFNSAAGRVTFRDIPHFNVTNYTAPVDKIEASHYADVLSSWGYAAEVDREPAGNGAESATQNVQTAGGDAGKPTEGETSTFTPATASGEVESQRPAASTESTSNEVAAQNQAAAESGN